jgi:peptidoglycan/LPS O-acetylase OafA/YrhL
VDPVQEEGGRSAASTPPRMAPAAGARIPELDSLRGLAALGVLALHMMPKLFFWAGSCVDLFFILSGFLITSILLANRESPRMLVAFYVRRALRIWPVYYVTFIAALGIFLLAGMLKDGAWPVVPPGQWWALVFLQYVDRYIPGATHLEPIWYFAHSWSLAVEEQFYLVWPLLFFFLRPRLAALAVAASAIVAVAVVLRHHGLYFYLLATRIDGLMFGILLAYLVADKSSLLFRLPPRDFVIVILLGLSLLVPYLASHGTLNLWGHHPQRAVEVLGFCLVYASVIAASIRWSGAHWLAPLRTRALMHVGKLSFAIYMFQVPIGYVVLEALAHDWIGSVSAHLLTPLLTLLAAQLSYIAIERQMLILKARFPY